MRAIAIESRDYPACANLLDAIFRLRARVFDGRLGWNVNVSEGRERDEYDRLDPTYLITIADDGELAGCARLLPALGRTMAADTFPQLLSAGRLNAHPRMIESSRFCVDTALARHAENGILHEATLTMFAGIIEWSMANGYDEIVTVTDVRFERILKRAGWPLSRLGDALPVGNTIAVSGLLAADDEHFNRLKPPGYRSEFSTTRRVAA